MQFDYAKTFDGSTLPIPPSDATFPYTFQESVPFHIHIIYKYFQISNDDHFEIDIEETGVLNGYNNNNHYPCLAVSTGECSITGDNGGGMFANVTGYQREYKNGQQTAYYPISSFTNFNLNRSLSSYYNFSIEILDSTLPVIYRYDYEITDPVQYWYNQNWVNMAITSGYNIDGILNKVEDVVPDGMDFEIKNLWTHGIWLNNTQPQVTEIYYRCLRGRIISGRMSLYRISGIVDNALKFGIKSNAIFYGLQTSTDGITWVDVANNELPFNFFYRPRVDELGEFNYGLSISNDTILIFPTEEDADRWEDDGDNAPDAENWDEVSPNYPPQVTIGEPDEDPTEMGEVYTRAFFSQQYICDAGAMSEIANALFDTMSGGIWEDIKKGLEMYGDSPVDDIQGCMFFPFPLSQVFTNVQSQNYIYFGGYRFDLQNNSVSKIIYPNGYIDFGSWRCPLRFGGSFRDFAPYRRLYVYMPYIGWAELDLKRYLGKLVNVKYYIDTRTGGAMACLFADGILYDYFNGQIGISMPITATDFVAYANAQINTLLGGAGAMKNNASTIANAGAGMVEKGVATAGGVALGLAPVAGLAVGAGVAKTMYGLTQNNINNFNVTKGASSSMLNAYLPQNVMFLDEVQDGKATPNELSLMGYPSNASGNIQNFNGYLEVDAVNLVCDTATENERAEIIAMLRNGVYI